MSAWRVETRRHESGHAVHLIVGVQSFALPCGDGSYDEAEWWAEKLRHAIEAIESAAYRRESKPPRCSANVYGGRRQCAQASRTTENGKPYCGMHTSRLPSCSGCEPGSEGTHAEGTRQHP